MLNPESWTVALQLFFVPPLCELLRLLGNEDDSPPLASRGTRLLTLPGSHSLILLEEGLESGRGMCEFWAHEDDVITDAPADAVAAILWRRFGNVSMTRSRNSRRAPTSFCNSCRASNDFACSLIK